MTTTRPPDRRRPAPPRFWPFPIDIDTEVCDRCSAMVPATDKARQRHRDHHGEIDNPDPSTRVSTPEPEAPPATAGRSGVEAAKPGAGSPPGVTSPRGRPFPPVDPGAPSTGDNR